MIERKDISLWFVAALFLLFAYFQFNDPDGWKWIVVYGSIATLAVGIIFQKVKKLYFILIGAICLLYFIVLIPEFISWVNMGAPSITESMKAEQPHIEFTREFFGILISMAALGYLFKTWTKRKRSKV